jgi:hypothetical protein
MVSSSAVMHIQESKRFVRGDKVDLVVEVEEVAEEVEVVEEAEGELVYRSL